MINSRYLLVVLLVSLSFVGYVACFGTCTQDSDCGSGQKCDSGDCTCINFFEYIPAQDELTCTPICRTACTKANTYCSAPNTCTCSPGYKTLANGQCGPVTRCNGTSELDKNVCSGHGSCVGTDKCVCDSTHYGSICENTIYTCFGIQSINTSYVCSGYGECTANDKCKCPLGTDNADCSLVFCINGCSLIRQHCGRVNGVNYCFCNDGLELVPGCTMKPTGGYSCNADVPLSISDYPNNGCAKKCGVNMERIGSNETCVCKTGYSYNETTSSCEKKCEPECINGVCTEGVCICAEGYTDYDNNHGCVLTCTEDCIGLSWCNNATCNCPNGYQTKSINSSIDCEPICDPSCGKNMECLAPNQCTCKVNYELVDDNSYCLISCHGNYSIRSADNETCICQPGYITNAKGVCEKKCTPECTNGVCTDGICTCNKGFVKKGGICYKECSGFTGTVGDVCADGGVCSANGNFRECKCKNANFTESNNGVCRQPCSPSCASNNNVWCNDNSTCICNPALDSTKYRMDIATQDCKPICYKCGNLSSCYNPDSGNDCFCDGSAGYARIYDSNGQPTRDCEKLCNPQCKSNSRCIDGLYCQCNNGYTDYKNNLGCVKTCPYDCTGLSWCNEEVCNCPKGYQTKPLNLTVVGCEPICDPSCGNNSYCSAPNNCTCLNGYEVVNGECQKTCPLNSIRSPNDNKCYECSLQCVYGKCQIQNGTPICECNSGFIGDLCEKKCNLKCQNGQCNNDTGIATCECNQGFAGILCENTCSLQCVNGQCKNETGIASCECDQGFEGVLCEKQSPNRCDLHCVNGVCKNETGTATCECDQGFEGILCEKEIFTPNRCDLKCVNGKCNNETGIATCVCNQGFEGSLCEKEITNPNSCNLKCVNGICKNDTGIAVCECDQGYEGSLCEKQIVTPNRCDLKCVNGKCTNETGTATCVCNLGFEGELCEKKVNVKPTCNLECANGGSCVLVLDVATCECINGYRGVLCEKSPIVAPNDTIICTLSCLNGGACVNTTEGIATCECNQGFEGVLCEKQSPNRCDLHCVNGVCKNDTGIATCECDQGFEGILCEKQIVTPNRCDLKCINGKCNNETGVATCVCIQGFEGELCEKQIVTPNRCNLKCVNGACKNETGIAVCECNQGFEGNLCENQITNPTPSTPICTLNCMNGGLCQNDTGIAKCQCKDLFIGELCATCKLGFIVQNGVCVCPNGYKNVENTCVRLPADCSSTRGCGQFGECTYMDETTNTGICKCQIGYSTIDVTNPCSSCSSGYSLTNNGKCSKICPAEYSGEDCSIYTLTPSCVSIPSNTLSFCKSVFPSSFRVLNTQYVSNSMNTSNAKEKLITSLIEANKRANEMYNQNIALFQSPSQCNETCKTSNIKLACLKTIQSCSNLLQKPLCKSVCEYIIQNEIQTYPSGYLETCSNLPTDDCYYGTYLPPNTMCYGKKYTDSSTVCSGRGDCIDVDTCVCKQGYTGTQCSLNICYSRNSNQTNVCSSNGQCIAPNNCLCNTGYTGIECATSTCNGKTELEGGCNFHGTCSLQKCTCNGNFDGPSCSICKSGFTGLQCDIPICNGISSIDTSVCSGRGSCITENGQQPICKCKQGYSGTSCQTFMCNGIDRLNSNVCSMKGKGINSDTCTCNGNFNPSTYCSTCLPSFNGTDCQNRMCTSEGTCQGRGTCNSQFKCVCSGKFTGDYCDRCIDGYVGDNCQFSCSPLTTCNGKGTCSPLNGQCICSGNSEGTFCSSCKSGFYGDKCDFSIDISSFGFNENGDTIYGSVKSSMKKIIDCSQLITNVQVLGNNPICNLNGDKSLMTIILGTSSTISIGGNLNLKRYFTSDQVDQVTILVKDFKPVEPVAIVSSDKVTISKACSSIYLDASSSSSLDRRPLTFSWKTNIAPDQQSSDLLDSLLNTVQSGVKFVATDLSVGYYSVQVTVSSSFSKLQSVASVSFTVTDAW